VARLSWGKIRQGTPRSVPGTVLRKVTPVGRERHRLWARSMGIRVRATQTNPRVCLPLGTWTGGRPFGYTLQQFESTWGHGRPSGRSLRKALGFMADSGVIRCRSARTVASNITEGGNIGWKLIKPPGHRRPRDALESKGVSLPCVLSVFAPSASTRSSNVYQPRQVPAVADLRGSITTPTRNICFSARLLTLSFTPISSPLAVPPIQLEI